MEELFFTRLIKPEIIIPAVFGIIGTLLGVLAGFSLQIYYSKHQEKIKIKNEFEYAKARNLNLMVLNDYYIYLKELRDFFVKYNRFWFQPDIKVFWENWLQEPILQNPVSMDNATTPEAQTKMIMELKFLELDFKYNSERHIKKLIKKIEKENPKLKEIKEFYKIKKKNDSCPVGAK